jgi:hypothetical protein
MAATLIGAVRKRLLTPPPSEVNFVERGFDTQHAPARHQLETSALQFMVGFEFGIEQKSYSDVVLRLEMLEREFRGFGYEGAAMAMTIKDVMSPLPGNRHTERFLSDYAPQHIFMAYIGIGFAFARLPKALWRKALPNPANMPDHPTLSWLVVDGIGFHQAFFDTDKWIGRQHVQPRYPWDGPQDYVNRAIDQGIGRATWFINGGDVDRLTRMLNDFPPHRQGDLWSGAALAAGYAGGVDADSLELFRKNAGPYGPEAAQGAIFAIKARVLADLVTPYTEMASQILCDRSAEEAAALADASVESLPETSTVPPYEIFRQRVQSHF